MVPFLDLAAQYQTIRNDVEAAVLLVLRSGRYVLGPQLEAFEAELAGFCGVHHAVGVDSGTSALALALAACGVRRGDEVVVPAVTFVATVEAVLAVGARPVLADVDPSTGLVTAGLVERAMSPRTRAIIPVHLYGQMAPIADLVGLASGREIRVIEDAAQAIGVRDSSGHAGTGGLAGCFSFYAGKNLGACGEAGAVITNSPEVAARVRRMRHHGQSDRYDHVVVGWNARLDEIQAAILRVKLRRLEEWNDQRRAVAQVYRSRLSASSVGLLPEQPAVTVNHHLFPVFDEGRDGLRRELAVRQIETGVHYPRAVHQNRAYHEFAPSGRGLEGAERVASTTMSLPMFAELSPSLVEGVCEVLTAVRPAALT